MIKTAVRAENPVLIRQTAWTSFTARGGSSRSLTSIVLVPHPNVARPYVGPVFSLLFLRFSFTITLCAASSFIECFPELEQAKVVHERYGPRVTSAVDFG